MTVRISDFIETEHVFGDVVKYFTYNIAAAPTTGLIMELGVYKGSSINRIAEIVAPRTVYGFDSFKGLPQQWSMAEDNVVPAGHFTVKQLPKVKKNVELVVGLFNDTLMEWTGSHQGSTISLLHLNCDIYSSTIDSLMSLNHLITAGTVIIFDDMYSWLDEDEYPYWRRGQWKALREWLDESNREVKVLSRMRRRHSCSVIVTK